MELPVVGAGPRYGQRYVLALALVEHRQRRAVVAGFAEDLDLVAGLAEFVKAERLAPAHSERVVGAGEAEEQVGETRVAGVPREAGSGSAPLRQCDFVPGSTLVVGGRDAECAGAVGAAQATTRRPS